MPTVVTEIVVQKKEKTDKFAPTRIRWKDTWLLRQEAFIPTVRDDIVGHTEREDVTKIGLIGKSGSGKTTLADTIAHVIHKESNLSWVIRRLTKEDLRKFDETIATLTNANHILIFDDLSFLDSKYDKKTIMKIEQSETEVRHVIGDHKIVLIYNYHYTRGLIKFLRQADFRYFTTVGSEEMENMENIVGKGNMWLVKHLARATKQKTKDGKRVHYFLSPRSYKKHIYTYKLRNPFIPTLFYDNSSLRFIVTPTREWLDPICSICTQGDHTKSQVDVPLFCKQSEEKFGNKVSWVGVIKQLLKEQGVNTYGSKYTQMRRYLDRALEMKQFNLNDLAVHYGLTVTKTRLNKKLDGVLLK